MYVFALPSAVCSEVMRDPTLLPDSAIEVSPATLYNPALIRGPTAKGWEVYAANKPSITLRFVPTTGDQPVQLQSINFYGNVKSVKVQVQRTLNVDFEDNKDGQIFDVSNEPLSFVGDDHKSIEAFAVRIDLVEAIDTEQPFAVRLQVYACIKGMFYLDFLNWLKF